MNISMSELIVVLLIALLVIKPEQMPGIARRLGQLTKKVQGMMKAIKSEVNELYESASQDKK